MSFLPLPFCSSPLHSAGDSLIVLKDFQEAAKELSEQMFCSHILGDRYVLQKHKTPLDILVFMPPAMHLFTVWHISMLMKRS